MTEPLLAPLRWAKGQDLRGAWHVVVRELPRSAHYVFGAQVTACGRTIVQSEDWNELGPRAWLRSNACPTCLDLYPILSESDEGRWPGWHAAGVPAPLFVTRPYRVASDLGRSADTLETGRHPQFDHWIQEWQAARAATRGGENTMWTFAEGQRVVYRGHEVALHRQVGVVKSVLVSAGTALSVALDSGELVTRRVDDWRPAGPIGWPAVLRWLNEQAAENPDRQSRVLDQLVRVLLDDDLDELAETVRVAAGVPELMYTAPNGITTRDVRLRAAELAVRPGCGWAPTPMDVWYGRASGPRSNTDLGALVRVAVRQLCAGGWHRMYIAACRELSQEINSPGIFGWENAPGRTVEDVVTALRGEWPADLRTDRRQHARYRG
jgi:hypothetical protein